MNRKTVTGAAAPCIAFAAVLIALLALFSALPGSDASSPWVTFGLPLLAAWCMAVAAGRGVAKRFALATACLLVAAPIVYYCAPTVIFSTDNTPQHPAVTQTATTTPTPAPATTQTPALPEEVTLTVLEPDGEGAVSPAVGQHAYESGENVALRAAPGENWFFSEWRLDNAHYSDEAETWLVMEDNHEVQAVFKERIAPPRSGYVAFRFSSSFTYLGSDEPITDVGVELPWPYLDEFDERGRPSAKPVWLEGWLRRGTVSVGLSGLPKHENFDNFMRSVWKLENEEPDRPGDWYDLENTGWCIPSSPLLFNAVRQSALLTVFRLAPTLKLSCENGVEWEDGQTVGPLGSRATVPSVDAYFNYPRPGQSYFLKLEAKLPDMYPGETLSVEGAFYVPENDADKVRMDDWIDCGAYSALWNYTKENVPIITFGFSGKHGHFRLTAQLEKDAGDGAVLVRKYDTGPLFFGPKELQVLEPIHVVV